MKEQVDPITVAEATIGQLSSCELPVETYCPWYGVCNCLPPWEAVDEASER